MVHEMAAQGGRVKLDHLDHDRREDDQQREDQQEDRGADDEQRRSGNTATRALRVSRMS